MGDLFVFDFTGTLLEFICNLRDFIPLGKEKENTAPLKGHSADFSDENCSQNVLNFFLCVCCY